MAHKRHNQFFLCVLIRCKNIWMIDLFVSLTLSLYLLTVSFPTIQSELNRKFKFNTFSMSNYKSDITNKITATDIIQKSDVIFSKGTSPRMKSRSQSKMQNRSKYRNVSKLNLPMSNFASESIIRFTDIDLL